MISLRMPSRSWLQALALAVVACHSAEPSPARFPPPAPAPPPLAPSGGAQPHVCDGQWHAEQRGDFAYDCRCRVLGPDAKSVDGLGQADLVKRMNAASPLAVAVNKGLYEALGLSAPRCGEASASWQFAATEPARASQCRLRGTSDPVQSEDVSVNGELELELAQGHRERIVGRTTLSAQRSGLGPVRVVSPAGPPLSFTAETQDRVVFQLQQEDWRVEALAHLPASPTTTALFKPKAPSIDSFETTFGVSLGDWLERMTVVRRSCVIETGTSPAQNPARGAVVSGRPSARAEPVAVDTKILGAKLVELHEPPCSLEGAHVKLQLVGFPGLAPTTVSGNAFLLEDRRHMIWPTAPQPTSPGPAAVVRIGGTAVNRIDVPAPKSLVDSAPCAARQSASLEAQIAAVPGSAGPETSIAVDWRTPCANVVMRCRFQATK